MSEPIAQHDIEQRFWSKVDRSDESGCWHWTAATSTGYGVFQIGKWRASKLVKAHRFAYELLVGPIPDGLVIDHLCRNRACVNPAHLEPVTHRVNILRGTGASARAAKATHCPHGHSYAGENLYVSPKGDRRCRTCARNRVAV